MKFSVIIPTMWLSDLLLKMLHIYDNCEFIAEVIIIDNNPFKRPDLSEFNKVSIYTKDENIYVNPSWNWGASLANYPIILANDDIYIEKIEKFTHLIQKNDWCDIVGLDVSNKGIPVLEEITEFPEAQSYGCLMYVKNYINIPESLKIWYGDVILFKHNRKKAIIRGLDVDARKNTTVNLFRNTICKQDVKEYARLKDLNKLAICIPTWKRPEITEFVFKYYKDLKETLRNEMELILITVGSEGDFSKGIAERNGFNYYEFENNLVRKHDHLYRCAKTYNPDAVIKVDSDSIISIEFFRYYNDLVNKEYDYAGVRDIYFAVKDAILYWSGYGERRNYEPTGVGRFMSRRFLDELNWTPWGWYNGDLIDRPLTQAVEYYDTMRKTYTTCKELGGMIIDIKSPINITNPYALDYTEITPMEDIELPVDFSGIDKHLLHMNLHRVKNRMKSLLIAEELKKKQNEVK